MSIKKVIGPILIFGAGGFIGFNLLLTLLKKRSDVFGVSHNPKNNWRLQTGLVPNQNIMICDMNNKEQLATLIKKIKPKTIFNLAAYGAYSSQQNPNKIYETNFLSTVHSIEIAKQYGFDAYVYAGTSSEYGLNCASPKENEELIPNSHYAVSKAAVAHLIQYYGQIEKLPITHLRLYSAYGPWEEPKRLIPQLVVNAERGTFPPLVNPNISRDYVYIDDVVDSFILTALNCEAMKGTIYNVATAKKTTIKDITRIMQKLVTIKTRPVFSTMPDRDWDLSNWYGTAKKFKKLVGWEPKNAIELGLKKTILWHTKFHLWHL